MDQGADHRVYSDARSNLDPLINRFPAGASTHLHSWHQTPRALDEDAPTVLATFRWEARPVVQDTRPEEETADGILRRVPRLYGIVTAEVLQRDVANSRLPARHRPSIRQEHTWRFVSISGLRQSVDRTDWQCPATSPGRVAAFCRVLACGGTPIRRFIRAPCRTLESVPVGGPLCRRLSPSS